MKALATMLLTLCLATSSQAGTTEDIQCLALNIYHEARGESTKGQRAVGLVTLNRVMSKSFPNNICDVVFQPSQFSWTKKPPEITEIKAWYRSVKVAQEALLIHSFGLDTLRALDFHTVDVNPYWKDSYTLVAQIGNHKFYRR